jgi:hypothetical protein
MRIGYLRRVNKRPGQIKVTVESGFCSFCDRTRSLRREERQLGTLVRTVISCESCHRVLSSTIGVATPETPAAEQAAAAVAEIETDPSHVTAAAAPSRREAPRPKPAAAKPRTAAAAKSKAPTSRNRRTK